MKYLFEQCKSSNTKFDYHKIVFPENIQIIVMPKYAAGHQRWKKNQKQKADIPSTRTQHFSQNCHLSISPQ